MLRSPLRLPPVLAVALLLAATSVAPAADDRVDFTRDIRPILSDACFQCHGPDEGTREADLRLDNKDAALGDRGGYAAFVPGKPGESEAFRRMTSDDPQERMPPADSAKQLTAQQIDLVKRWIEQGADWSEHWAFIPPVRPSVPQIAGADWPANPLDTFVLARLQREQLAPAPAADRTTLLRRLTLDLIGLPPAVDDVDEFLADDSPAAFEKQVDRLLASVHYGERWGRHWLDAARYADSDGFEKDKQRQVWFYRDWVVDAFNRDLPYDRFIIEQIAGDLLVDGNAVDPLRESTAGEATPQPVGRSSTPSAPPANAPGRPLLAEHVNHLADPATQSHLVATGFLRNSMINEEGGVDPEQFRMEAMFDRMDAIGKGILGLTIQCAQCHTHKFDPITHTEYYRLFAFLNNAHEANVAAYTPDEQMQRADVFREIAELEAGLRHRHPDWPERMAAWEDQVRDDQPEWSIVRPELDTSGGQKHYLLEDGSILAQGYAPTKHTTEFTVRTDLEHITAARLELLNDPNLPLGGPGRSIFGLCALTEFHVVAAPADRPHEKHELKIVSATADANPGEHELADIFDDNSNRRRVTGPVAWAIDRKDETAWGIDVGPGRSNVPRKAVFVFEKPVTFAGGAVLTFRLTQNHGGWNSDDNQNNNLGRFRLSITSADSPVADPLPAAVREILAVPREQRTPRQTAAVFSHWRATVPEWEEANNLIEAWWRQHPPGASQLVLLTRDEPRQTHLLDRGDFLKPKDPVEPGVPAFLHPLQDPRSGDSQSPRSAGATSPSVEPASSAPASPNAAAETRRDDAIPPRLAFARWLVDPRSPTTSRALVNRVWQTYFGTGLVRTSEDLGRQSEPPTHPDLLDWLAVEFMGVESRESEGANIEHSTLNIEHRGTTDHGQRTPHTPRVPASALPASLPSWSLKHLHRLILTSATYRQSSQVTEELLTRDPFNRFLARGPRFRVDAEVVRDMALAASGLLNRKLRGPSVYPPAPDFLFAPPASYGPKVWDEDTGPDRYRRAVYTFRYRSVPYPALDAFDAPNGDASCVRRARSNTPLQALVTLNEPLFVECAEALAGRMLREGGATDRDRMAYGFRLCLSRGPTEQESAMLLDLLNRQQQRLAADAGKVNLAASGPATGTSITANRPVSGTPGHGPRTTGHGPRTTSDSHPPSTLNHRPSTLPRLARRRPRPPEPRRNHYEGMMDVES